MSNPAIILKNVQKDYHIFQIGLPFFKTFTALKDISFSVPMGQVLGLIGHNGAGKSTLLKIITGNSKETSGMVKTEGRILAILNIATGIMDELSGRENITSLGKMYGVKKEDIDVDSIITFSGLGDAIEYPVRTYSTGMRMRLAFSIVTSIPFDILLIDEALSVGDSGFSLKCRERIHGLCRSGKTVVIVSHGMTAIKELCDRVIWLEHGRIKEDGLPAHLTERYRASLIDNVRKSVDQRLKHRNLMMSEGNLKIISFELVEKGTHEPLSIVTVGQHTEILFEVEGCSDSHTLDVRLELYRSDGTLILEHEEHVQSQQNAFRMDFGEMRLGRFIYEMHLKIMSTSKDYAHATRIFSVYDDKHAYNSSYYPDVEWIEKS